MILYRNFQGRMMERQSCSIENYDEVGTHTVYVSHVYSLSHLQ
jgi:hypothetical protein